MSKHHGLYKFVTCDTDEIIYIGKTNNNLKRRIADHIRGNGIDEKFNAYKDNYKVFIAFMPNAVETDIMERALINQYKPVLNGTDNYEGFSNLITIKEPQWLEFEKAFPEPEPNLSSKPTKIKKDRHSEDIYLGELFGTDYYLTNTRSIKEHGRRLEKHFFDTADEALEYIKYVVRLCEEYGTYNDECHKYVVSARYGQQFFSFWNNKCLGPGLVICKEGSECYYSIIKSMSGKGDILEKIFFNSTTIDIFKLITDELFNAKMSI